MTDRYTRMIEKGLKNRTESLYVNANLGNYDGVVETGVPYEVYARLVNGSVVRVKNYIAPTDRWDLRVKIGRDARQPGEWVVISVRDSYAGGNAAPNIPSHNEMHRYLPIYRDQILPLLALPISGELSVQIYGSVVVVSDVWAVLVNQILDLSSSQPTEGARWVLLQYDNSGVVTTKDGTVQDSKEALIAANQLQGVPAPDTGNVGFCCVALYDGQTEFSYFSDFARPFSVTGGGGGSSVENLDDLADVDVPTPSDGQVLAWDAYLGLWVAIDRVVSVNGQTGEIVLFFREKLTGTRTYYVRSDGDDSNDGLTNSSGGAFLTVQKAIDVASTLDNGGYDITIQVADGTYTGANVLKSFIGAGKIIIRGNNSTPANVVINPTSANCFTGTSVIGAYEILDLTMKTTTAGHGIVGNGTGTQISFGNVIFDTVGSSAYSHVFAQRGAWIRAISSYTIVGCNGIHLQSVAEGILETNVVTVTLTGTPTFTTYAECLSNSIIRVVGCTFSGSATGKRYNVNSGVIEATSSETYLPGDTLGTKLNNGVYGSFTGQSRVSTQFDKTNTTLANITGLTATLLAGRTYKFRATLYTSSNVASGVKFAIAGTATATAILYEALVYNGAAIAAQTRATALGTAVGGVTAATAALCIITGTITVNAAGTLTVQFADNAGTNTSSVLVGSEFIVEDIT